MPEQHDVDQQRQLPPELEIERSRLRRDARHVRDDDREGDEEHHPRLPIADLTYAALEERESAVEEDHRSEDRGDASSERERGRRVVEPVLDGLRPDEDRDGQQQRDPETVAEHGHAMAGMLVMPGVLVTPRMLVVHRVLGGDRSPMCSVIVLLVTHCCPYAPTVTTSFPRACPDSR